tara:strand:- start:249 stop:551 length:303 start_codon:yes stop_codon:yes gene_type:complete
MNLRKVACVGALTLGLGSCGSGTYLWNQDQTYVGQGILSYFAKAELLAEGTEQEALNQHLNPEFTTKQKIGYGLHFCGYIFLLSGLGIIRNEEEFVPVKE